uniref:ATP-binding protein n=1 Tax=Geoglobus ahangari TaxID=113653 RepID=A0A7C3YEN2_9EURY
MFVNRIEELELMEGRLRSERAEFIVVYGRRRIGKTALLLEFIRRNGGIYLLARETSNAENLRRFSERLAEAFSDELLRKNPFQSWDAFFEYINQKSKEERLVVVIDEFPYLVEGERSLPSILQEYWDLKLSKGKLYLIICGSSVSMMEKLLGYRSPIYGRRTGQLKLHPLDFFDARGFLPKYSMEEFVKAYSILGGTPAYLLEFSDDSSLEENLKNYFKPDSFLYSDAYFILREELDEPRNYFAIMEAIARGKTTLGDIMAETGLEKSLVGKYLSVLSELELVRRETPITAGRSSRKGRYYINDPYFTFWFRYVHPNVDIIETNRGELLVSKVMNDLSTHVGRIFEDVARQFILRLNRAGVFRFTKIGRWWHRDEEIDLVALDEGERKALFVEVKWRELDEKDGSRILRDLERKSELVGLDGWEKSYGLVAKKIAGREELEREGFLVWDLKDFEKLM